MLLLPGNLLPLNVFEPRYLHLVRDALGGEKLVGMIQPRVPSLDNWGPAGGESPELYGVGCAGRLTEWERQDDGRYLIVLRGLVRFRVRRELAPVKGYRRVRADFTEFLADLEESPPGLEAGRLLRAVRRFARAQDLEFDQDLLASLAPRALLHALCAALPFSPGEKQALLEAPLAAERERLLLTLMEMGVGPPQVEDGFSPPLVH